MVKYIKQKAENLARNCVPLNYISSQLDSQEGLLKNKKQNKNTNIFNGKFALFH